MAEGIVFTGRAEFKAALGALSDRMDRASQQAVADGLAAIQREAMKNSSGRPGPNVVTGSHRRSFVIEGPIKEQPHVWVGRVGPTMVYSRRLELGGGNWPAGLNFPYFEPALETVSRTVLPALFKRRWSLAMGA